MSTVASGTPAEAAFKPPAWDRIKLLEQKIRLHEKALEKANTPEAIRHRQADPRQCPGRRQARGALAEALQGASCWQLFWELSERHERMSDATLMVIATWAREVIEDRNRADEQQPPASWEPWGALRRSGARLEWAELDKTGGLIEGLRDGSHRIILDGRLRPGDRPHDLEAVLTHELVHQERGVPHIGEQRDVVDAEEAQVRRIARERMLEYRLARSDQDETACCEPTE